MVLFLFGVGFGALLTVACMTFRSSDDGERLEAPRPLDATGPGPSGLNGFDASHGSCGQRLQRAPAIVAEHPPAVDRDGDRRLDDEWAAVLRGPLHGEESHHAKGFGSTRT